MKYKPSVALLLKSKLITNMFLMCLCPGVINYTKYCQHSVVVQHLESSDSGKLN